MLSPPEARSGLELLGSFDVPTIIDLDLENHNKLLIISIFKNHKATDSQPPDWILLSVMRQLFPHRPIDLDHARL
jgi:hypothetical protein